MRNKIGLNGLKWGIFLGTEDTRTSLNGLEKCEMLTRQELMPDRRTMSGCSGPKDQQHKTYKFLSLFGVMYAIVNPRKGKALKEHILRGIVPRGFEARIKEIQGKHQQAIAGRDNQKQAFKYQNVALQAQRDVHQTEMPRHHYPSYITLSRSWE